MHRCVYACAKVPGGTIKMIDKEFSGFLFFLNMIPLSVSPNHLKDKDVNNFGTLNSGDGIAASILPS